MAKDPVEFTVEVEGGTVTARHFAAATSGPLLVLGHGAGADQRHRFMVAIASRLAERGVAVVTFNFLYTERKRRSPDRAPVLEATWTSVLDAVVGRLDPVRTIAVGGKSMGGRIASMVAASKPGSKAWQRVGGLVLLGYPLHPPGQPEKPRVAHLPSIDVPILIVQGTRDTFGTREEIEPVFDALKTRVDYEFIDGGDHSFAVPRSSGHTEGDILDRVADRVAGWLTALR
jgi:predicted alpha/beta-hydrolase family hydrolase